MKKIAIIGGGASGLLCALQIARANQDDITVTIYEKLPRIGKKILVTGNGRGNLSNRYVDSNKYNNPKFVSSTLTRFSNQTLENLWRELGLETYSDEEGRCYPLAESATAIVDILRLALDQYGVEQRCDCEVMSIKRVDDQYIIYSQHEQFRADYVVVAMGGKAGVLSSTEGLIISLNQLGHHVTSLVPSLSPLKTSHPIVKSLTGLRLACEASLFIEQQLIRSEYGELLFKENALSGIVIFQLSSEYARYQVHHPSFSCDVELDLFPKLEVNEVQQMLEQRVFLHPLRTIEQLLTGIYVKMVAFALLKEAKIEEWQRTSSALTPGELLRLSMVLKHWRFPIISTFGFAQSQVTSGGINLDEIDAETLESKKHPNLYFTGEIMDIDGETGGYNLHFAFASACVVAQSICLSISQNFTNKGAL